jgi:hypothetical protein
MEKKFAEIKDAYDVLYKERMGQGKLPLKDTGIGFWAISTADDIFHLFKSIHLKRFSHMLDLGSGDGKVSIIGSIFTKSSGIEYDEELHNMALKMKHKTKSSCLLHHGNYLHHDFSRYDFLFIHPDKRMIDVEQKIKKEFTGTIVVYGNDYKPLILPKKASFFADTTPVHVYEL